MHNILQDISQVRSICQQLAQNERQNAQMIEQSNGNPMMAQREMQAAQQLEHCIQLCNHMEQDIHQMQSQNMHQTSSYGQNGQGQGWQSQQMQHVPSGMMQQVMQADRQTGQYAFERGPSSSGYMQYPAQPYYQPQMPHQSPHSPMMNQVMQADHPSQQNRYTNYGHN